MMNSPGTSVATQFARAQLLQQQGQLAAARTAYQAVLDADPNHIDTLNAMGVLAGQMSDLPNAIQYFDRAIAAQPGNSGAHCNRGLALKQLGQLDAALGCFDRAVALDPGSVIAHYSRAEAYKDLGRPDEALASYDQAIAVNSGFLHAFYRRGVLLQQIARPEEAIASYDRVLQIKPDHLDALVNRGSALSSVGQSAEALASYDRAIALKPEQASLHSLRGDLLRALDRREEALASYEKAIAINPHDAQAHCNRGIALHLMQKSEAIASFDKAIEINPDYFEAHANRAIALFGLGRRAEALLSCDQAIELNPDQAFLYVIRGDVLRALVRREDALASYNEAIAINPDDAEAHCNRGITLMLMHRTEAIPSFDKAIQLNPDYAEPYFHRAYSLRLLSRFDAATADYRKVVTLAPDFDFLPGSRLEASLQVCDWSDYEALVAQIAAGLEKERYVTHPFIFMALMDSARLQHEAARIWVRYACSTRDALEPIARRARPRKLTVGYFSCDFHEHPVGRLLVELIELHDRSRFEVIAFSFGPKTGDPLQQRLSRAFDRFFDVRDKSDLEIASLARELDVDIAVDLGGHTRGSRTGIFALRAAPIQINYLGYAGTMGAEFMDYLIADDTVVPQARQDDYAEKIIYLPESFMPFDSTYAIADKVFTREELGLPPHGFVFCCFNNSFKLTPVMFDCWMSILARTNGAVLWLSKTNPEAAANLRAEASRRGIDERRLIFAERMDSLPEHLARLRAADLFLDTFPYNAHATALDALWAGLPMLTYPGEGFASRVAASLLRSLGLPEVIAGSLSEYEETAVNLATDSSRLGRIRGLLAGKKRAGARLFDTPRFTRDLEAAYAAVHNRYQEGLPPDHVKL
jgi:protein O-GlcNAc transferase